MTGQMWQYPAELISKIVREIVLANDIETIRKLAAMGPSLQQALDEHILTVCLNINHDPGSKINTPDGIPNHERCISRTKIYPERDLSKELRMKCQIDHTDRTSDPSLLNCTPCDLYQDMLSFSDQDIEKSKRYKMIIVEVFSNRYTCLECDKVAAFRAMSCICSELKFSSNVCSVGREFVESGENPFYHLQIFKVLPFHLDKSYRMLGQRIHCDRRQIIRESLVVTEDIQNVSPLYIKRDIDIRRFRYKSGSLSLGEWSVHCPSGNFVYLESFPLHIKSHTNMCMLVGTIDVLFYINPETLPEGVVDSEEYFPGIESFTFMLGTRFGIDRILSLRPMEYKHIIKQRARNNFRNKLKPSNWPNPFKSWPSLSSFRPDSSMTFEDKLSVIRGQQLMKLFMEVYGNDRVYIKQYHKCHDLGYDLPNSVFQFFARFQIHESLQLQNDFRRSRQMREVATKWLRPNRPSFSLY